MSAPRRSLLDLEDGEAKGPELASETASLVLRADPGRPLNKAQRAFNRLVEKIERLRTKLARDTARFDEAVVFHHEHVRPLVERATALRKDVVRFVAQFVDDKRFKAKSDRRILEIILQDQLEDIAAVEGTLVDGDLRAIFETVHGIGFDQAEAEDSELARKAMEEMFRQQGVDGAHQAERAAHQRGKPKPKTKRQLEAEAREREVEALRKKSVGTIYRQLAKVLHPDLEQDPDRRVRKGVLMQDVTAAYRNNDLHTLLRLELAWIHREEADAARLTDETLGLFNDVLQEQVAELEQALEDLRLHPKYGVLVVMGDPYGAVLDTDGPANVRRLEGLISGLEDSLIRLRSREGWREVRDVIRLYRTRRDF